MLGLKDVLDDPKVENCYKFAEKAHGDQKRRYTHEPYITHPLAVAGILNDNIQDGDINLLCAALLHDVLEL